MRGWKIVVSVLVVALAPSLSSCTRNDESVSQIAELVAQADAAPTPRLDWKPCAETELSRYQCAVAAVPIDYAQPNGPTLSLAIIKQPAGERDRRIGTLFTAVGGPGGSGFKWAGHGELFAGEVARRFDVITFDQRGIGRSGQVRCFSNAEEQHRFWSGFVLPPTTAEQESAAARNARALAAGCAANSPELLPHLTTVDAARDLDLLRRAVGDPSMTFEGGSYASYLGEVYGALFGDRVRALQLGSMIDPDAYTNDSRAQIADSAAGTEEVLSEFLRLCAEVGQQHCAFAGATKGDAAGLRARNDAVLDRLRQGSIVIGQGERTRTVTLTEVLPAHATMLYDPKQGWPALAELLTELERGPAGNPDVVQQILAAGGFTDDFLDAFTAITCADSSFSREPEQWPALASELASTAPHYGAMWLYLRQACAAWPVPAKGYPQRITGPWILRSDKPALLFNNRFDPVTPLTAARRAQQELVNARLVIVEGGYGHNVLSDCAGRLQEHYLVDLQLPAPGATCKPDGTPFAD
ncbi:alpha/beta hydrolase [Nocardia sp. NBC_00565]|uniref:alpha/beta hydrolase n=1 Tax=Nocardia sp. NBC_00565 TaxID=2975993 RepID=UPI002E81B5C7|nr:alpha/beta hydrolase [Nocardia sp. NBC_00565]WUC01708.1 alpha/beta hydrolase [Nocardia sp. NBC_00565]